MQRAQWDYRTVKSSEEELNQLGQRGWEAVGAVNAGEVLLKRPAMDFREQVTLDQRRRYFALWGLTEPEDEA